MNLKQLVVLLTVLIPYLSIAQNNTQTPFKCGVSAQAGAVIKQRLMDNRNKFTKQEVKNLMTNRTTTYIPVSIHNVAGDVNGLGKTSEITIMNFLCGLNALYADQDVQFFIHGQIHNRVSNFIYNDAGTSTSRSYMMSYRIPNTLNLIIGASTQNPRASWYDTQGDFVFLLQQMLTPEAKTEAHEIGHFFTLNHTFYGWESVNATTYNNQNVPAYIGWGSQTEAAARTGNQANCQYAADGFCDTPADYFSDRTPCPYNPQMKDRYGNAIDPDESNMMSYAYDNCVTSFSTEQKTAIAMDIAARNWVTNTPASTADVTGIPTAVSPVSNGQLGSINSPTVRLEWSPVAGATWYYLEVYGTMIPGLWLVNTNDALFKGIVYSSNPYYDLSTSNLVAGSQYAWRVKALNSASTCAGISTYHKFEAVTSVATSIKDLPIEQQMKLTINSNPVTGTSIPVSIYSAEEVVGSIRIYSMDGREALALNKQVLNEGESLIQLPAEQLANGMYVAVLTTDRGQLQQKLIIQR